MPSQTEAHHRVKVGQNLPNHPDSQFVEVEGKTWHVQTRGTGPRVLLIHGTAASTHSWAGLFPLLAKQFDVLAPDLPGHGFFEFGCPRDVTIKAMAANVTALCETLDFVPEIVVGHSAGAAILVRMCIDKQITPRMVISLNGALLPFPGLGGIVFPAMARLLFLNALAPSVVTWQAKDKAAVSRVIAGTGSDLDDDALSYYAQLFTNRRHVKAALSMMAQWDLDGLKRDLARMGVPVHLVAAQNDLAVPPERAFEAAKLMPSAHLSYVRGLGHLAHEEDPDAIARLICDLIRQVPSEATSTDCQSGGARGT